MALQFGLTWWGKAYLEALTEIDLENRLARGKSYARKNRITGIKINENIIEAKVSGSRPRPYKIRIIHTPLSLAEQRKLSNALASRPDIVSDIINYKLPESILEICHDQGIQIFPSSLHDFGLHCSCPDWAVPCKHIAAVLYTLANEIDRDPFLVFKLLKFDLAASLRKKGYQLSPDRIDDTLPALSGFIAGRTKPTDVKEFDKALYESIDLSIIPDIGLGIPEFLEERPVFYHQGDFRKILSEFYKRARALASRDIKIHKESPWIIPFRRLKQIDSIRIVLHPGLRADRIMYEGTVEGHGFSTSLKECIDTLQSLSASQIDQLAKDFKLVVMAYDIAHHLMARGAFIPAIYKLDDDRYTVKWEPFINVDEVRSIMASFQQLLPDRLVPVEVTANQFTGLRKNTQAYILVSLLIEHIAGEVMAKNMRPLQDKVYDLFFGKEGVRFEDFSERSTATSIHQWLEILSYSFHAFRPVIRIGERKGGRFYMSLGLEDQRYKPAVPVSLADFMQAARYKKSRTHVLKILSLLSHKLPSIKTSVKSTGKNHVPLTHEEVIRFLDQSKMIMQLTQAKILFPRSLQSLQRPSANLRISSLKADIKAEAISLHDLLQYEWKITLGNRSVNIDEFRRLAASGERLIKSRDKYVMIESGRETALLDRISDAKPPRQMDLLRFAITGEYDGIKVSLTPAARKLIDLIRRKRSIAIPPNITAELRPYQKRGFEWLYKNAQLGFGSILADDMGLGKTLQVLVFLQKAKNLGWLEGAPALIIAPATLLKNWVRECQKFTPELRTFIYHGQNRALPEKEIDMLITTYGTVRTERKRFGGIHWAAVVIDEAQNIKNPSAAQTKSVINIPSRIRIAVSGTPVENRLMEYYSISQFANPGYLDSIRSFKEQFANPIERHRDHHKLELFKKMTSPFILRRLKTDTSIIKDLPDKIVLNRYTSLTAEQISLYKECSENALRQIESEQDAITRRGHVLTMLLQLKQICNHPRNYTKQGSCLASRTGKSEALQEIIEQVHIENSKVLVFTQYREMGEILTEMLNEMGDECLFFHGGLSTRQRDEMIRVFQHEHWPRILVLSIKAGGTGLNLTAATHVIHYDLWWNPAVETQATDRAFRIGQKHNVTVHRLITRNTLEENIDKLIEQKKDLAELTVSTGEKWIGELSNEELKSLINLG